jgi:hypothetical protein
MVCLPLEKSITIMCHISRIKEYCMSFTISTEKNDVILYSSWVRRVNKFRIEGRFPNLIKEI